jgi:hypothetical protein
MRVLLSVALLCIGLLPALAQSRAPAAASAKGPPPSETYAAMTLAERAAIQSDLVWTGYYAGIIDGDFGNRSVAAVRAFQKARKSAETGILNPRERSQLAVQAKARREEAGWRRVDDSVTGVSIGLPAKLVPQASRGKNGARWASASGDIAIETFRINGPDVTLAGVAAQLRAVDGRKVDYDVERADFFVLTGSQGARKFYIRAHVQDHEVRGFTILYDAAKDRTMQPITVAISNAFAPFSGRGTIQVDGGTVARRKVEYTTGLIASDAGHILADRQATEGCRVIQVLPNGPAERVADDAETGLSLLRIYGAGKVRATALSVDGNGDRVTLVGIADPSAQSGGSAVTAPAARLLGEATDAVRTFDPAPPQGFSGAAVVDQRGRFRGVVLLKPQVVAGPGGANPQAVLVPADVVRKFLRAHNVVPAPGSAAVKDIRASVVRVVCVRS